MIKLPFKRLMKKSLDSHFKYVECETPGFWYSQLENRWVYEDEIWDEKGIAVIGVTSVANNCKSVKSFRRKLKKWSKNSDIPKGTQLVLVSSFKGMEVYGKIK